MFSEPRSDDVLALLAAPPEDEYALLEFALDWPGLHGVEAQLAAALRLFVITRDPLDWLADRGCAWATANANGDTLELPMYITRDEVQRQMRAGGGGLETTLGTVGESVLVVETQTARPARTTASGSPANSASQRLICVTRTAPRRAS